MDQAADSSELLRRIEELQREMDEKVDLVEVLTRQVENLQRERDELRKDIEQLCMQQAGPGYVSVATRMLTQRTAALEQDIENLQKKLGGCLRENQNLQEELAEAYRIKSQLAELHGAALSKNKDLEKQVRFFQSSVAQAFAERDSSLMECEKAKEREEAVSRKFADFEERMREYQSEIDEQKHLNDDLQRELTELKAHTELSLKVILKFYDLRCRDSGCSSSLTIEEKCSILLGDSADNWSFSSDGGTSTLKYIASLEEEKESLKAKISKLQSNLRMGLEIEQHLQRNARILEKRQALYDGFLRNGLSELQKFYTCQKAEIMKILEEESLRLMKVVAEIQDKLTEICINTEVSDHPADEIQCCDSSCKDVHVTKDISPSTCRKSDYPADLNSVSFDESKALAQALQEKMEALMLFSQEQERYLLEKQRDLIVIEELQKNLSQVKDEKVKVLMELTKLKEQYLLLKGSAVKEGHDTGDSSKLIPGHDQQGMLKTMLKRTSLRHWMRKESNTIGHGSSDGNDHTVCKEHSVDVARLRVENAMLLEGVGTVEHLTSSVHRLHIVLLKAYDDIKSADPLESTFEALNSLITEANLMKTALNVVLPVSWSGDSSDAIKYEAMCDPSDSPKSKSGKVDPLSSAGMEMVELLILAAEILKESFLVKK
ncbi:myosin heavy chain-related [Zea mays]|uniref:Myosin heavy chain-related n=1 Tax=Zea mays TaxID=4577 RepID=A0A1D6PMU1_MAIZE|nr:myosin heavy chain-related [Zea mays]